MMSIVELGLHSDSEQGDYDSDLGLEVDLHPPSCKRKFQGSATYSTKFDAKWKEQYPCIQAVKGDHFSFLCSTCCKKVSCKHMGIADVRRHIEGPSHKKLAKGMESQSRLSFSSSKDPIRHKIERAEVKMCMLLAQHNVPLSLADYLSRLVRNVFDGEVASGYACAKTKTSCILNRAIAPEFKAELVNIMQKAPYSLSIDGSNDTGLSKMNPLTVRIFDECRKQVSTRFLDMCTTSGVNAATARVIFEKMDEVLCLHNIPWVNCIALSVDNTSVNIGRHNSIMSRVHEKNPSTYCMGCPCHITHNMAGAAGDAFQHIVGFDIEELVIDIFYWFDKSTKRKSSLEEYCCFCDVQYRKIVKHISTHWLSLEIAVERILKVYAGLRSYFLSESCSQPRFARLHNLFSTPITEVYLLFYQSILPVFNHFNQFLQREDPCVHLVLDCCENLLKKVLGKFIKLDVIKTYTALSEVNTDSTNQLSDGNTFIGFLTRQTLLKLENGGDCSATDSKKFMLGVRQFYAAAVDYIKAKFPIGDELLTNARFVNFDKRESSEYKNVEYFLQRYYEIFGFTSGDNDRVFDEFVAYQLLKFEDIPQDVWDAARNVVDNDSEKESFVRMDVVWAFLGNMKTGDGCNLKFPLLSKIAKLVLTLPHSNAGEERVFSLVRLNKTPYRSSLNLEGTLSSILTVKLYNPEPCYEFEPTATMLEKSKKVTWEYNREHKK